LGTNAHILGSTILADEEYRSENKNGSHTLKVS
jgi:hypothetical protein